MIKQIKWIERRFNFDFPVTIFPSLYERLHGTPLRVEKLIGTFPENIYTIKPENKWSLKERVGHIISVEKLWNTRLEQFLQNEKDLAPADMTNQRTEKANYNDEAMENLILLLHKTRISFLSKVENLSEPELERTAHHPRLNRPMRLIDLLYFVAEHDDNEIALMRAVGKKLC